MNRAYHEARLRRFAHKTSRFLFKNNQDESFCKSSEENYENPTFKDDTGKTESNDDNSAEAISMENVSVEVCSGHSSSVSKEASSTQYFDGILSGQLTLKVTVESHIISPDKSRIALRNLIICMFVLNSFFWMFLALEDSVFELKREEETFFGRTAWTTILTICRPLQLSYHMLSSGFLFVV